MTEQELKDGEAYQESPEGTIAYYTHVLETAISALEFMAFRHPNLLLPELESLHRSTQRLAQIYAAATLTRTGI